MFEGLLSPTHLLLILLIAMILLGPRKLPELGKGLGEAIRGFRESMRAPDAPQAPQQVPSASHAQMPSAPPVQVASTPPLPAGTTPEQAPVAADAAPGTPKLPAG